MRVENTIQLSTGLQILISDLTAALCSSHASALGGGREYCTQTTARGMKDTLPIFCCEIWKYEEARELNLLALWSR
jgi:hypothetical protein